MRNTAGMTITRQVTTVDEGGDPVATPDITFEWRIGIWGEVHTETPSLISTGRYEVSFVPDKGGTLYYRWDTEGSTDIAKEGKLSIRGSAFCS